MMFSLDAGTLICRRSRLCWSRRR